MTRQIIEPANKMPLEERSLVKSLLHRLQGISLRNRLLLFLLSVTLISISVVAFIAFDSIERINVNAQQISGLALTNQVKADLVQYNASISRENNRFFDQILAQANILADFVRSAYIYDGSGTELAVDPLVGLVKLSSGQYANSAEATTSVFVPNLVEVNDLIRKDVKSSAELDELFPSVRAQFPAVVALFFATPNQMTRYYPNINLGQVLPGDWNVTNRPWYRQAIQDVGNKPWVDPYMDATGKGLVTTASVPVFAGKPAAGCVECPAEGTLLGVIGMDVTLTELELSVEVNNLLPEASYSFILDSAGRGIILPNQAFQDIFNREPTLNELVDLDASDQVVQEFRPIVRAMLDGRTDVLEVTLPARGNIPTRNVIVAFAPLKSTGWSLGTVIEAQKVLQPLDTLQTELAESLRVVAVQRFLPSLVIILAVIFVITVYLTDRWIQPVKALAEAAARIGRGQWDVLLPGEKNGSDTENAEESTQDELQVLTRSFRMMKKQVFASLTALEERVAERTRQLERRSAQLQAAADLARDINLTAIQNPGIRNGVSSIQVHDLNWLLARTVDLISQRFGFYHAGIFLIDSQGEYAILRAATGEAGRQMLGKGHKLRIDRRVYGLHEVTSGKEPIGIVGSVAGTGIPRIALDTGKDVVHFKNPLLPKTRSEMALPLKTAQDPTAFGQASQVIGVLDVQSTEPDAFDDQDVDTLQILADQLAVAIENARLFQSYQSSLQELENLYSQVSGNAWSNVITAHPVIGYELADGLVQSIYQQRDDSDPALAGSAYLLPVIVRGETIAKIEIWPAGGSVTGFDKRLLGEISDHLSQVFESARLFEEAQARSFREQAINEFVAQLSSSLDLESLLKSAVRQLGALPNVAEVTITMSPANGQTEQNR